MIDAEYERGEALGAVRATYILSDTRGLLHGTDESHPLANDLYRSWDPTLVLPNEAVDPASDPDGVLAYSAKHFLSDWRVGIVIRTNGLGTPRALCYVFGSREERPDYVYIVDPTRKEHLSYMAPVGAKTLRGLLRSRETHIPLKR